MKPIRTAIIVFVFWTVVVGGIYPLFMTGIGALFFPRAAQGSLMSAEGTGGKLLGSRLMAQEFKSDRFFQERPSATGYDPSSSGASNQGYTSAQLKKDFDQRKADWLKSTGAADAPREMLYASGSGVDPHISPEAAELQVPRVAAARRLSAAQAAELLALVRAHEEPPQMGFLGEPRVNVLELNLAVNAAFPG
jgi:potassium-transporting ATPase KdpC subunit